MTINAASSHFGDSSHSTEINDDHSEIIDGKVIPFNRFKEPLSDDTSSQLPVITSEILGSSKQQRHFTRVLTVLFTDIVGSTAIKSESGIHKAHTLETVHKSLLLSAIREIRTIYQSNVAQAVRVEGDSYIFVFLNPSEAVHFALLAQALHRQIKRSQWPDLPEFRIGIHLGEVIVEEGLKGPNQPGGIGDIKGLQADTTARIMSLASGGQILCSYSAYENAKQAMIGIDLQGISGKPVWHKHGLYQLKGREEPIEICEVGEEGAAPLQKPMGNDKAKPVNIAENFPKSQTKWFRMSAILVFALSVSVFAIHYFIQTVELTEIFSKSNTAETAVKELNYKISGLHGSFESIKDYPVHAQKVREDAPKLAQQLLNISDERIDLKHKILKYQFAEFSFSMAGWVESNQTDKIKYLDQAIEAGQKALLLIQEAQRKASSGNKPDQELYDWIISKEKKEVINYILAASYAVKAKTGDKSAFKSVEQYLNAIPSAYKEKYPFEKETHLKWYLEQQSK